jgi:hypothetical protein
VADDSYLIVDNPRLDPGTPWHTLFTKHWAGGSENTFEQQMNRGYYRPLTTALFKIEKFFFGVNPAGYHAINIVLHMAVTILFLLFAMDLLSLQGAMAAGLIFATHAVHTEPVNVIFYQTTLLATFFSLLALWLHSAAFQTPRAKRLQTVGVCLLFPLALLSKETGLVLPIILLLYDFVFRRATGKVLFAPHYLAMWITAAAYLILRSAILPAGGIAYFEGIPFWSRILTMFGVYSLYLKLLFWPFPLCPFYEWSILPPVSSLWDTFSLVGVATVLLYLTVAIAVAKRLITERGRGAPFSPVPQVACFSLWLLPLSLLPVLHIIPILNVAGERFLYLGSMAYCLGFGLFSQWLFRRGSSIMRTVALILICLYGLINGVITVERNKDWRSDETLSRATLAHYPQALNARLTLGKLLLKQGRYQEALKHARIARKLAPTLAAPRQLENDAVRLAKRKH